MNHLKNQNFVYVITDVMLWDFNSAPPQEIKELRYACLEAEHILYPYVLNDIGGWTRPYNVNSGIGGHDIGICVKYEKVDLNATNTGLKVLTNIAITEWPNWIAVTPDLKPCPADGWEQANGVINGIKGAITPGTKKNCHRMGLIVQYQPFTEVTKFVSNLYLCLARPYVIYPDKVETNGGIWPMEICPVNMHKGCGDAYDYFLCMAKTVLKPDDPLTDNEKLECIQKYAPYVYFDEEELYYPSTVEFSFDNLLRIKGVDNNFWLVTKQKLETPSDILDYFHGDLDTAKVYAFFVEKEVIKHDIVYEVTYFFYYPYNRGKEVLYTIWGNHVGDWEHVTIRFRRTNTGLTPFQIYLAQHDKGETKAWALVKKKDGTEHPIVYSARGSHAMYFEPGEHQYAPMLTDYCSEGKMLDTSNENCIVAYDFASKKGLNIDSWPTWMSENFSEPGPDPQNPNSGGIYRWGNPKRDCRTLFDNTFCRLEDGPTGPISKTKVWVRNVFES